MKDIREIITLSADYLEKHAVESPKVDAEWLIGHALELERMQLYLQYDRPLNEDELAKIRALLRRRANGEPVQYICGSTNFFGLELEVGPGVLVPRPETERLVDLALKQVQDGDAVLDLCTGSGCIPLALQHSKKDSLQIKAIDICDEALAYARRNYAKLALKNIDFLAADLFDGLASDERFALITSNPPYVCESEKPGMGRDVLAHEPHLALFADDQGLAIIHRIAQGAKKHLLPAGAILMEIGASQAAAVKKIFENENYCAVSIIKDYSNRDRILFARLSDPL